MKHFFSLLALCSAAVLSAQTIAIDGTSSDWSELPMLSRPGTTPVVKMVVPQEGLTLPDGAAFCVMVDAASPEAMQANYPVIYTDADCSGSTGTATWICPTDFGYDYEMATWSSGSTYGAAGNVHEMCVKQAAFTDVVFSGSIHAWLTFNWGAAYFPTSPSTEGYKWAEATYHPLHVAPFTFAPLAGTHAAADVYATHQALAMTSPLNMKNAGSANDTLLWAAWTVTLTPGVYDVTADIASTNGSSVDLALVDLATNTVMATIATDNIWQPSGTQTVGEWDLSALPAGKYMLVFSNHIAWSEMTLSSVTITAKGATALDKTAQTATTKFIRGGQVFFLRDGHIYNALGVQLR